MLQIECVLFKHHFRSHDARRILGHNEAHSAGLRNWIREDGVSSSGETAREKLSRKQSETMEFSRNGITHQQNIRKQTLLRADLGLRLGELKGQQPKGEVRKAFSSYGFLPNIM